jgi:hypothetical protein
MPAARGHARRANHRSSSSLTCVLPPLPPRFPSHSLPRPGVSCPSLSALRPLRRAAALSLPDIGTSSPSPGCTTLPPSSPSTSVPISCSGTSSTGIGPSVGFRVVSTAVARLTTRLSLAGRVCCELSRHSHCATLLSARAHHRTRAVIVEQGFVGYAMDNGQPVLLPPGIHVWTSESLHYKESIPLNQNVISLGPQTLITVDEGYAAVTQNNGPQEILPGGFTHLLDHKNWKFQKWARCRPQRSHAYPQRAAPQLQPRHVPCPPQDLDTCPNRAPTAPWLGAGTSRSRSKPTTSRASSPRARTTLR